MAGYIKIYRDVLDTVLFQRPVLLQMWLFLSKQARYVKTVQDGVEVLPGQVLTSAAELAESVNLTERKVRYILDCLEEMEIIRRENIRNRYTLITLVNPDELRVVKQTPHTQEADTRQPIREEADTRQPVREESDTKQPVREEPDTRQPVREEPQAEQKECFGMCMNVYMTASEKQLLQKRTPAANSYIDRLSAYKRRTSKEYNDDFAVLCEWISKDECSDAARTGKTGQTAGRENAYNPTAAAAPRMQERAAQRGLSYSPGTDTNFFTAPASYDLELAERLARESVPVLRKRNRPKNTDCLTDSPNAIKD